MSLSKPVLPAVTTAGLVFAHDYKTLECYLCNKVVAFQHRATGLVVCNPATSTCPGHGQQYEDDVASLVSTVSTKAHSTTSTGYGSVASSLSSGGGALPQPRLPPPPETTTTTVTDKSGDVGTDRDNKGGLPVAVAPLTPNTFAPPLKKRVVVEQPTLKSDGVDKQVEDVLTTSTTSSPSLFGPKKIMPKSQETAALMAVVTEVKTATPSKEAPPPGPRPTVTQPQQKPFMWQDCKYSDNLRDGALVKTCFIWNLDCLQITSDKDETALGLYQAKIARYVEKGRPLTRSPIRNEIVIANYGGEDYYRGRVTDISGDTCRVDFVDFGDALKRLKFTELYQMTAQLMEAKIYSATVRLAGVKPMEKKIRPDKKLNDLLYSSLQLQMVDKIEMGKKEDFQVILWAGEERTLNDAVSETLAEIDGVIATPAEQ